MPMVVNLQMQKIICDKLINNVVNHFTGELIATAKHCKRDDLFVIVQ